MRLCRWKSGSPMACWGINQAALAPSSPAISSAGTHAANQFPQTRRISYVDRFHPWNVRSAQFSGGFEFAAYAQIFFVHGEEFLAQGLVDHSGLGIRRYCSRYPRAISTCHFLRARTRRTSLPFARATVRGGSTVRVAQPISTKPSPAAMTSSDVSTADVALTEITRSDQNLLIASRPAIICAPGGKDSGRRSVDLIERGKVSFAKDFGIEEIVRLCHAPLDFSEGCELCGIHGPECYHPGCEPFNSHKTALPTAHARHAGIFIEPASVGDFQRSGPLAFC